MYPSMWTKVLLKWAVIGLSASGQLAVVAGGGVGARFPVLHGTQALPMRQGTLAPVLVALNLYIIRTVLSPFLQLRTQHNPQVLGFPSSA